MSNTKQVVYFHKDYESKKSAIIDFIKDFKSKGKDVVIGERNSIKCFDLNGEKINVKSFKAPNIFNALIYKFIRKSKAKRSFQFAQKLIDYNISTPLPIAFIEAFSIFGLKHSYYISRHIDYDFDFRELIHNPKFPERKQILQKFTEFTFALHENNINFLDHSPGNTLIIKQENGQYGFYLIDLNRMRFESMDFNKRMHNFRRLWLSKTMIKIMAAKYAKLHGKTYDETHALMLKHSQAFQKKANSKKLRKSGRKMRFKTTN